MLWRSVLLVEKTGVPREITAVSQATEKLDHKNIVGNIPRHERDSNAPARTNTAPHGEKRVII